MSDMVEFIALLVMISLTFLPFQILEYLPFVGPPQPSEHNSGDSIILEHDRGKNENLFEAAENSWNLDMTNGNLDDPNFSDTNMKDENSRPSRDNESPKTPELTKMMPKNVSYDSPSVQRKTSSMQPDDGNPNDKPGADDTVFLQVKERLSDWKHIILIIAITSTTSGVTFMCCFICERKISRTNNVVDRVRLFKRIKEKEKQLRKQMDEIHTLNKKTMKKIKSTELKSSLIQDEVNTYRVKIDNLKRDIALWEADFVTQLSDWEEHCSPKEMTNEANGSSSASENSEGESSLDGEQPAETLPKMALLPTPIMYDDSYGLQTPLTHLNGKHLAFGNSSSTSLIHRNTMTSDQHGSMMCESTHIPPMETPRRNYASLVDVRRTWPVLTHWTPTYYRRLPPDMHYHRRFPPSPYMQEFPPHVYNGPSTPGPYRIC